MYKNNIEHKINRIYLVILPILILGISLGYSSFLLCITFLVIRLVVTDRYTAGFYLIMYGGIIAGIVRAIYPYIPIYGLLLNTFGLFLVYREVQQFFLKGGKAIVFILILYIILWFYYLYGPQDGFSHNKLIRILQQGSFTLFGYYLFCSQKKINNEALFQILCVSTVAMFLYVIQSYHYIPGNIFDYEWFRSAEYASLAINKYEMELLVSYQHIGMNMLFGLAIFISSKHLSKKLSVFYILLSLQLIMTSGCRQAILGLVVILILRATFFAESYKRSTKSYLLSILGVLLLGIGAYLILLSLNIDFITKTFQEGDSGRNILMLNAVNIFYNNIYFGCGLGGYHFITGDVYPHNFLLEILCEMGIVGLCIILTFFYACKKSSKLKLHFETQNGTYFFLVMSVLLIRTLVSADLTVSIELFSSMSATLAILNNGITRQKYAYLTP